MVNILYKYIIHHTDEKIYKIHHYNINITDNLQYLQMEIFDF